MTRSFRHPFKPKEHDPARCAYCLHLLDCAPHLPLAPTPSYPAPAPEHRTGTPIESRRLELLVRVASASHRGCGRAAR